MPRRLLKDTAIYGAGALLTKTLGFLLIPLYTRYLDVADYGTLALLNLLLQVFSFICLLGVSTAAMRGYHDVGATPDSQHAVYGNATLLLLLAPPLVMAALAWPVKELVDTFLPGIAFVPLVLAVMLTALFTPVVKLLLGLMRVERRPGSYIAFQLAFFLCQATAMVVALVVLDGGLAGQVYAQLAANALFWAVAIIMLLRFARPRYAPATARALLGYGVPLIPFFILSWGNEAAGRFMLERYDGLAAVGLFTLASQFAGILGLVALSVENALMPHFLREAAATGGAERLGRLALQHFGLLGLVGLGINLVATPAILVMAAPEYREAARYVAPLTLGAWLYLAANPAIWLLNHTRHSGALSWFRGACTVVLIGSLWLGLGPLGLGIAGVAWAAVVTGIFAAVAGFGLALRHYPLALSWARALGCGAIVLGVGALMFSVDELTLAAGPLALDALLFGTATAAVLWITGTGNPLRWLRSTRPQG
jgi:O-antigen/teichoic acid export membrane protein